MIQAGPGNWGGVGGLRTKRSGWTEWALASTTARAWRTRSARPPESAASATPPTRPRLSDLASVGDAGSEAIQLAKGLLSDSQTRVVYQQASNELQGLRELLQLTDREVAAVSGLSPGMTLWKVGQRSFVVEHVVSRAERWMVDTEPRAQG